MGVGVLEDSPILKPQDLAGKKVAEVPTYGEFPFFPAYAKNVGLDINSMPFVFAGMKVGVTMAMIGVIVGEFITAQVGLGYIIMVASSAGETETVLAATVLLCVIGLVLYGIVALAELVMRRWYGGEIAVGGFV